MEEDKDPAFKGAEEYLKNSPTSLVDFDLESSQLSPRKDGDWKLYPRRLLDDLNSGQRNGIRFHRACIRLVWGEEREFTERIFDKVFHIKYFIEAIQVIPHQDYIRPWGTSLSYRRFVHAFYREWNEVYFRASAPYYVELAKSKGIRLDELKVPELKIRVWLGVNIDLEKISDPAETASILSLAEELSLEVVDQKGGFTKTKEVMEYLYNVARSDGDMELYKKLRVYEPPSPLPEKFLKTKPLQLDAHTLPALLKKITLH